MAGFYANPFEEGAFLKETIRLNQNQADIRNKDNLESYNNKCKDWKVANTINQSRGIPITSVPQPPNKVMVDQKDGSFYNQLFPYNDVPIPTLDPPTPMGSQGIRSENVPADSVTAMLNVMFNAIKLIYTDLQVIKEMLKTLKEIK